MPAGSGPDRGQMRSSASGCGGCVGLPQNPWGPNPDMGEPTNRYPLGCGVDFPNENPYYPCLGPQQCVCSNVIADMSRWLCPL